jgi:hypothetical protein
MLASRRAYFVGFCETIQVADKVIARHVVVAPPSPAGAEPSSFDVIPVRPSHCAPTVEIVERTERAKCKVIT